MDGSISEGFKIPFVTSTFYEQGRDKLRYRIIGVNISPVTFFSLFKFALLV